MTTSYEHQLRNPSFLNHVTGKVMPNTTGWQTRHRDALRSPTRSERHIISMLVGWAQYADQHSADYESGIGNDGVLGEYWRTIGVSIHGLLNGETGRLDCGTLSAFIYDTLKAEGFNDE